MNMYRCPSSRRLIEQLAAPEPLPAEIREHLAECSRCRQTAAQAAQWWRLTAEYEAFHCRRASEFATDVLFRVGKAAASAYGPPLT